MIGECIQWTDADIRAIVRAWAFRIWNEGQQFEPGQLHFIISELEKALGELRIRDVNSVLMNQSDNRSELRY